VVFLTTTARDSDRPRSRKPDGISAALVWGGTYAVCAEPMEVFQPDVQGSLVQLEPRHGNVPSAHTQALLLQWDRAVFGGSPHPTRCTRTALRGGSAGRPITQPGR
jgi:hypothetical protein